MKVLIISRGYPTGKYPLNGIFEFDQAKALANLGHKVIFASVDMRSIRRIRKWGIEKIKKEGIEIYGINLPIGRVPKSILSFFTVYGLKKLYTIIEEEQGKPDIMHSHFTGISYAATKLKEINNVPLVMTEHSSLINKVDIDKELFKIARITYKGVDKIITVSPTLKRRIEDKFNIKSNYIPNIVDLDIFKYEVKNRNGKFNIVSTGNLIDVKRMDLTIQSFYEAFSNNTNATLTIFGHGPNRKMLEILIEKYKLNERVKLMGQCTRNEIAKKLKETDLFVLASQSETFGVAYLEALAMGIPVIATKCGGPESFVNDNNGILIDVNSRKQLVNAMKFMYENIDNYDKEAISNHTKQMFSAEAVGELILNEYNEVLLRT